MKFLQNPEAAQVAKTLLGAGIGGAGTYAAANQLQYDPVPAMGWVAMNTILGGSLGRRASLKGGVPALLEKLTTPKAKREATGIFALETVPTIIQLGRDLHKGMKQTEALRESQISQAGATTQAALAEKAKAESEAAAAVIAAKKEEALLRGAEAANKAKGYLTGAINWADKNKIPLAVLAGGTALAGGGLGAYALWQSARAAKARADEAEGRTSQPGGKSIPVFGRVQVLDPRR